MVVAIVVIVLWAAFFMAVAIVPFLPPIDTAPAPVPREFARRTVKPSPTDQHERAA